MLDSKDLLTIIKKASIEAIESIKPVHVTFGKVISESPLKIQMSQKLILSEAQLVLTNNVRNRSIPVLIDNELKTIIVRKSLKINDNVVLFRMQGGQKYIVLDRISET